MKKSAALFVLFLLTPFVLALTVQAASAQSYQDYLFQFDLYRQKYNDFQVAKNTYEKFNTLESQSQALSSTKTMLAQRNTLIHAYLLYLYERVGENGGITQSDKQLYLSLLGNELAFLETQNTLVPSINSIEDAVTSSQQLESRYPVLQTTIRKITASISLGQLNIIAQNFDKQVQVAQSLVNQNAPLLTAEKRTVINNWLIQIGSKRSLYQQKIDLTATAITALASTTGARDIDRQYADIVKNIDGAKQYLADAIANLNELSVSLQYIN